MTIAVIWQEDGFLWCAADTRLVEGKKDEPTTDVATKIYTIPLVTAALNETIHRQPHYWTQFGFVYAGAALPASMTAITASTLLQSLARPGDKADPPKFEEIAEFVRRLSDRFMRDRRQFGGDGLFSAAFFGWCTHEMKYKVAHIDGRIDGGAFRVELHFPEPPAVDKQPWLVLGSASSAFTSAFESYKDTEPYIRMRVPRRVIEKMVAESTDQTVGGATSIGAANQFGFELYYALEPIVPGQPAARRVFNGLDLDTEVGHVGQYLVAAKGLA